MFLIMPISRAVASRYILLRAIRHAGYDNKEALFCKEKTMPWVYKTGDFVHNRAVLLARMAASKNKQEARLQELILSAKRLNIEVRSEKLLREAGYRTRSGSCRVKGQDVILLDRDARLSEQIEFLAGELAERQGNSHAPD
jgi:hypothetical protein